MNKHKITGLPIATSNTEALSKLYVDNSMNDEMFKDFSYITG